jgi:ketosteroid isomerase-like protein
MDLEDKKRAACEFLRIATNPEHRSRALDMLSDDAVWCLPLHGAGPPFNKAQIVEMLGRVDKMFKGPSQLTIHGVTAEGDRVAIEAESYVHLANGRVYNNLYHFLIVFSGDKIRELAEYNDSKYAAEAFEGLF